jgi:tetratricopeptide (TPR) repeat protein
MRYVLNIFLILVLICGGSDPCFSQDRVDSMKTALKTVKNDTSRILLLSGLAEIASEEEWAAFNEAALTLSESYTKKLKPGEPFYRRNKQLLANAIHNKAWLLRMQGNTQTALELHHKGIKVQEEIDDQKGVAQAYTLIGAIHQNLGNIREALELFTKSLELSEKLDYKKGMAEGLLNISTVYQLQGNIPKALESYDKSLKLMKATGNTKGMAHCLNNMGLIYFHQHDINKALENYTQSLKLYEITGDVNGIATLYNNVATVFKAKGDQEKALDYFTKSYNKYKELPEPKGMAMASNNIGSVYTNQNKTTEAISYHTESLKLCTSIQDKMGMVQSLNYLAGIHIKLNNYNKALAFTSQSMPLSKELGFPELISEAAKNLSKIYANTNNYKAALENFELHIKMEDSLASEINRKASIRSQLKYEYERKAAADSINHIKEIEISDLELQKQTAELTAQRHRQYVICGGLVLVLLFAGMMYKRYRATNKQKLIIEEKEKQAQKQNDIIRMQKAMVEEKQKEIIDSINYARRIQKANFPTEKYVGSNLSRLLKKTG